jgi:hypothetical protein
MKPREKTQFHHVPITPGTVSLNATYEHFGLLGVRVRWRNASHGGLVMKKIVLS